MRLNALPDKNSHGTLRELAGAADPATRTYAARTNSLELTQSRETGGVASMQDVYQAQILVSTAEASIADTHRRIEQQENLLSILLGHNPGDIQRIRFEGALRVSCIGEG